MSWGLNFQTGYALARCALAYGQAYIPFSDRNHKVTELVHGLLFTCDAVNTVYVGSQIQESLTKHKKCDNARFYVDLAVNMTLFAGVGALFVMGMNRYLVPTTSLTDLLNSTTIPKKTLEVIADTSIDNLSASWTKTLLENLTTGLFFMRTVMDLGLAYLTQQPRHLFHAAIHTMTTWKTAHYCTLVIHHSFDYLLEGIEHSFGSRYGKVTWEYFSWPIKKVEAIFYLNVEGLSKSALIDKIQAIYDYSSNMFHKSVWLRDQFDYEVTLAGDPPPVPVALRIFHKQKIWQPFQWIDIFQWIPRFMVPEHKIPFAKWINADLITPLTRSDTFLTNVYWFLGDH